jgi:hypothetical protein
VEGLSPVLAFSFSVKGLLGKLVLYGTAAIQGCCFEVLRAEPLCWALKLASYAVHAASVGPALPGHTLSPFRFAQQLLVLAVCWPP